ncbi:unnamed protein product [Phytophthora lilii]|uniref:Unnamed protein product n=1 Tax=Phytophthora lilii TaxID=2077276 RepID=A0A9W6U4F2_9STRA|nr:unnamed protein product [Phytophthora lilii]
MQPHASCMWSLTSIALALGSLPSSNAATCKTLGDSGSTLATSLASWLSVDTSVIPVDTMFAEIDDSFPWFSKCMAAINPQAVYISLGSSSTLKSCLSTLEEFELDLSSADGWAEACPVLENTVIPCVQSAMTEAIMDAFDTTSGCCDDFLAKIKYFFGDSLDDMVNKLLKLGGNAACAERSFTNLKGTATKELCGYSAFHSFMFIESDDDAINLLSLAQMPNDQMCNAFEGKTFTNTKGGSSKIGFGTNDVDTMGICLQPVDALMQYVASWPIFSLVLDADGTDITLSDLFTAGKNIRGNAILAYAKTSTNMPMMFLRAIDNLLETLDGKSSSATSDIEEYSEASGGSDSSIADAFLNFVTQLDSEATALKLHIPNNGGCTYPDQSITEPFGSSTTDVTTQAAGSSSSASKTPTFVAFGVMLSLLATMTLF